MPDNEALAGSNETTPLTPGAAASPLAFFHDFADGLSRSLGLPAAPEREASERGQPIAPGAAARSVTRGVRMNIAGLNPELKKAADAAELVNVDKSFQGWLRFYRGRVARGPASYRLLTKAFFTAGDPDEVVVPERYLEAAGEVFILTAIVGWIVTVIFSPETISRNLLRDIVGYNNVCVGLDEPPARFVVVPLFTVTVYCGIRYVVLDTLRANLQLMENDVNERAALFTKIANALYAVVLLLWPGLLVITPGNSARQATFHTFIFFFMILAQYLVILANFIEAKSVHVSSKVWLGIFSVVSLLMPIFGLVDFNSYDYQYCYDHVLNGTQANTPARVQVVLQPESDPYCRQAPAIPWGLLCFCDYSWFVLLAMTTIFLPDAEPLYCDYELVQLPTQNDDDNMELHRLEVRGSGIDLRRKRRSNSITATAGGAEAAYASSTAEEP